MSFSIEAVRKFYEDSIIQRLNEYSKRLAKLETDNIEIESDDIVGRGDGDHSILRYDDRWNFHKKWSAYTNAITFDGVNDYLDLGAKTNLWSKNISKFSLSLWVKGNIAFDNNYRTLLGCADDLGGGNTDAEISVYFLKGGIDTPSYNCIGCDVTRDNYTSGLNRFSKLTVNRDQEYHVGLTFDNTQTGSNIMKLYINGVLQSNSNDYEYGTSYNGQVLDIDSGTKMLLGAYITSDTSPLSGYIRDFRYWGTVALTANQMLAVNKNLPTAPIPDYWILMNDGPSSPVDLINGYTTTFNGALYKDNYLGDPLCTFEPDFQTYVLDLRFGNMGNTLIDYSGYNNHAEIFGEPCPTSGIELPYIGGSMKSTAHAISQNEQIYYVIEDTPDLSVSNETIGHTIWLIFNPKSLANSNGVSQRLMECMQIGGDDGFSIRLSSDGNLHYLVRQDGSSFFKKLSVADISIDTDYEVVFTYAVSGDVQHIYVNDIDRTLTSSSETFTDTGNSNVVICADKDADKGFCDLNFISRVRFYQDLTATPTQVDNLWNNKISISNIPAYRALITDGCVMSTGGGFTDSFSSAGFST